MKIIAFNFFKDGQNSPLPCKDSKASVGIATEALTTVN